MRLSYILTEEDYIQFNINAAEKVESYRKTIKLMILLKKLMLVCAIIMVILMALDYDVNKLILFVGTLGVFLSALYYPKLMRYSIRKNAQSIAKKNADIMLGEVVLELNDEWIIGIRNDSERKVKVNNIKYIEETAEYLFVYISDVEAFIIPRKIFEPKVREDEFLSLLGNI